MPPPGCPQETGEGPGKVKGPGFMNGPGQQEALNRYLAPTGELKFRLHSTGQK